jgi:hypothetical protein
LQVSLRGAKSNRQGVGARLTVEINGQKQVREMYPACSFRSQAPNVVHFGLGDSVVVDRLTIRWPSGRVQEFRGLRANRHIDVAEGGDGPEAITNVEPGKSRQP